MKNSQLDVAQDLGLEDDVQSQDQNQLAPSTSPKAPEFLTDDEFNDMYTFKSISKLNFFKKDAKDIIDRIQPMNATVYKGNFVSQFGESMYRFFGPGLKEIGGNVLNVTGEQFMKLGEFDGEEDSSLDTFGVKLRNFGLYMGNEAERTVREREELMSITGTPGDFFGQVSSSILSTLGLMAAGAAVLPGASAVALSTIPAATFAVASGAETIVEGRKAGASYEKSMAYGLLVGGTSFWLERLGLNKIFGGTYVTGKNFVAKQITTAMLTEGLTEGAQQMVEIGGSIGTGARDLNAQESVAMISETLYAAAVGMVAGGAMVSTVAIPQRFKAIKILTEAGMDHTTAKETVDKTMQQTADEILETTGQDFGFDEVANKAYNKFQSIAQDYISRRGGFSRSDLETSVAEAENFDPARQVLSRLFTESAAEVRGEGIDNVRPTPVTDINKVQENIAKTQQAEDPNFERPIVSQPVFDVNTSPEVRKIVSGRIQYINGRLKEILRSVNKSRKLLKNQVESGKSRTQIEQDMNRDFDEAIELTAEANAIRENPNKVQGDKIVLDKRDIIRATSRLAIQAVRNAKNNFRLGRASVNEEVRFVRMALNKLVNAPGLSKETRALLKQKFSRLTADTLIKQVPVIEQAVRDAQEEAFIPVVKEGIQRLVNFFKGAEKNKPNMDLQTQKVADAFVQEFEKKDPNPTERLMAIDGSPESIARFQAAQVATGKNGATGADLTPQDYVNIFRALNELATKGKQAKIFNAKVRSKVGQKIVEQATKDVLDGKANTDQIFGNANFGDMLLSYVTNWMGTYNGMLSMITRHAAKTMGKSFTEIVTDLDNAERKASIQNVYYTSEMDALGKKAFGLKTSDELVQKLYKDGSRLPEDLLYVEQPVEESVDPEVKVQDPKPTQVLSRAEAREKYMLSLRPEGRKKMLKTGWTEAGLDNLLDALSPSDIRYIQGQLKIYSELYVEINKVYSKLTGMELPRSKNYSPIITELDVKDGISMVSALFESSGDGVPGVNSASFLQAVTNKKSDLVNTPDYKKTARYIADASYYIGTAETINRIDNLFSDKDFRKAVKSRYGQAAVDRLDRFTETFKKNSLNSGNTRLMSGFNKMVTRYTQAFIAAKPSQVIKQMTSFATSMAVMGPTQFVKHMGSLYEGIQDGRVRKLIDDPFFRDRAVSRTISRDIRQIQETIDYDNSRNFLDFIKNPKVKENAAKFNQIINNPKIHNFFFLFTQLGDLGGAVGSAWPLYQYYQTKQGGGFSEAEARLKALEHVRLTQQSGSHTQLSQVMQSNNPFARLMTAFTQVPVQYMNQALMQFHKLGTKNFDWSNKAHVKEFGNMFLTYFVVLPALFGFVSSAFKFPDLEDDEEVLQLGANTLLGPFSDAHIVGPILDWAAFNVMAGIADAVSDEEIKGRSFRTHELGGSVFQSVYENLDQARRAIHDIAQNGVTTQNFLKALTEITEATFPVTGGFGGAARQVTNAVEGVFLAQQDPIEDAWRRYLMLLGFSRRTTDSQ